MKKLSYLLLLAVVSFASCSKDSDDNNGENNTTPPPGTEENYIQGKVEYKFTFTNPTIARYIDSALLITDNLAGAFHQAYLQQTSEDRQTLDSFIDNSWNDYMALMIAPIAKSEVFISDNHARSIAAGVTFQIDKTWDIQKETGSYYIGNIFDQDLSFNFDYSFAQGIGTVSAISTDLLYDRAEPVEGGKVGDLDTKKIVYTPKPGNIGGVNTDLVIYTSPLLRKDINILLPIYTNEEHGIAKIEVNFSNAEMGKMIIEITSIQERNITNEELNINVSSDHSTDKDINKKPELSEKIFNIMLPVS